VGAARTKGRAEDAERVLSKREQKLSQGKEENKLNQVNKLLRLRYNNKSQSPYNWIIIHFLEFVLLRWGQLDFLSNISRQDIFQGEMPQKTRAS
jgi:hypothetical protein